MRPVRPDVWEYAESLAKRETAVIKLRVGRFYYWITDSAYRELVKLLGLVPEKDADSMSIDKLMSNVHSKLEERMRSIKAISRSEGVDENARRIRFQILDDLIISVYEVKE